MLKIKLPFGLKDGKLFHIDNVSNGLACDCVCPACGALLVARNKGETKQHHFAHHKVEECYGAVETALHRMAKQLLSEKLTITTPIYDKTPSLKDQSGATHSGERVYRPANVIKFDRVSLEVSYGRYVADVVGYYGGVALAVEIYVTHSVDTEKATLVKDKGEYMMEVDLGYLADETQFYDELFEYFVLNNPNNRIWISHPDADKAYAHSIKELKAKIVPINKEHRKREKQREDNKRSFAKNRDKYRAEYLDDLDKLQGSLSPGWQSNRSLELEASSQDILYSRLRKFNLTECPSYFNIHVQSDWIFNAHRSAWQSGVYEQFIYEQPSGSMLKANDVKKWVVAEYGILDYVYRLNIAKQKGKQQGRERNQWYGDSGAWFFDKYENDVIPSPYQPVVLYLQMLSQRWILEDMKRNGEFIVVANTPEAYSDHNRLRELRFQQELQRMVLEDQARVQGIENEKDRLRQLQALRIELLLKSENRVVNRYGRNARRCSNCFFTSHENDGIQCPFCGQSVFSDHILTDSYLQTARNRYKSATCIKTSVDRLPELITSLLD